MIHVRVRVSDDKIDWFPGLCELAALPPIGGHIQVIDRNANQWWLRVVDVRMEALPLRIKEQWPSASGERRWVTIYGVEVLGNPHESDSE